jgi:hypothetical protein
MGVNVKTSFSPQGKQEKMTGQNHESDRSQFFSRIIRNAEHFFLGRRRDFRRFGVTRREVIGRYFMCVKNRGVGMNTWRKSIRERNARLLPALKTP